MQALFPYAGSSRKYANVIAEMVRREGYSVYAEPMVGSGAVLFELCPKAAVINDVNELTMCLYRHIKENKDEFIEELRKLKPTRENFDLLLASVADMEDGPRKAAVWYFLLWLCYNGVVKYSDGKPYMTFGDRYATWERKLEHRIQQVAVASIVLRDATIMNVDYADVPIADIAFFDPPWIESGEDYGVEFDHDRLVDYLSRYKSKWILTINHHELAIDLYSRISMWQKKLEPYYSVAPVKKGRGKREEILLANFIPKMFGG